MRSIWKKKEYEHIIKISKVKYWALYIINNREDQNSHHN